MAIVKNDDNIWVDFLALERELLNNAVVKKNLDLKDEEVIKASQRMDKIILYCYKCMYNKKK